MTRQELIQLIYDVSDILPDIDSPTIQKSENFYWNGTITAKEAAIKMFEALDSAYLELQEYRNVLIRAIARHATGLPEFEDDPRLEVDLGLNYHSTWDPKQKAWMVRKVSP